MKTIKIIGGIYGYRKSGSTITTPKSRTDPPFEISDEEAVRLIEMGVAVYADEYVEENEVPVTVLARDTTSGSSGSNAGSAMTLPALRKLNKGALEKIAEKRGVDISGATNNASRAELIFEHILEKAAAAETEDEADEDGEGPPVLGANAPV